MIEGKYHLIVKVKKKSLIYWPERFPIFTDQIPFIFNERTIEL